MRAFVQRQRSQIVAFLRSRKLLLLVVLVLGIGEIFEMVGAGAAMYSAHSGSQLNFYLRIACFVLAVLWTGIRLYERYKAELSE